MKIDKVKRKAAGHTCLLLFHAANTVRHGMRMVTDGSAARDGLGDGLTEKERAYINRMADDMNETATKLRKLGWRFLGR